MSFGLDLTGGASSLGQGLDFAPGGSGGSWGGDVSSAATAALSGFAAGGPVGAAIGAGASVLGGFMNRSASSKQNLTAMAFQQAQNDAARENVNYWNERNISFARENRDWQEKMANTAHAREVADLRAAGLNPILSARGGSGAPVSAAPSAQVHGAGSAGGTPHLEPKRYDLGGAVQSALAAREKIAMLDQIEALTEKERASTGYISEQAKTEIDRRVNLRADTELKGIEGKEREARIRVIREEEEKLWRENFLGNKYGEQKVVGELAHTSAETKSAEASASLHQVNAALSQLELQVYKENPNLKEIEHYMGLVQKAISSLVGGMLGGAAAARGMRHEPPVTRTPLRRR